MIQEINMNEYTGIHWAKHVSVILLVRQRLLKFQQMHCKQSPCHVDFDATAQLLNKLSHACLMYADCHTGVPQIEIKQKEASYLVISLVF